MALTINEILCGIEAGTVDLPSDKIEVYTTADPNALLPIYEFSNDDIRPLVSGKLDDVYSFIDYEQYLDYSVPRVCLMNDGVVRIYITYKDVDFSTLLTKELKIK